MEREREKIQVRETDRMERLWGERKKIYGRERNGKIIGREREDLREKEKWKDNWERERRYKREREREREREKWKDNGEREDIRERESQREREREREMER